MSTLQPAPRGRGGTFLGMPSCPRAVRTTVRDARSWGDPPHATHTGRDKRAKAVAGPERVEGVLGPRRLDVVVPGGK
ncbi:hypothetical protein [Streptomyces sp. NPDC047046]|uniref:hypothetical protein n=1 Tax=Streptomyces sp. NPDC047046 TaxID=3155378 RepID=UPI0033E4DFE8